MNWLEVIARRRLEPLKVETVHVLSPVDFEISLCCCIISCLMYHLGKGQFKWTDCKKDMRQFVRRNVAKRVKFGISCGKPSLTLKRKEYYPIFRKTWFCICHLNGVKYRNEDANTKWREILNQEVKYRISNLDDKLDNYTALRDAEMLFMTQDRINDMYNRLGGGCGLYDVNGNLFRQAL